MSCWYTVSPLQPRRHIAVDNAAREGDVIDNIGSNDLLRLADLSAEQHWNNYLSATVNEEVIQAKWRVLESLSERQKA